MKTNFKSFALAALVLLGMGACSNELDEQLQQTEGQELTFNLSINGLTRTSTDVDRATTFVDGDLVGLFAYEKGTQKLAYTNVKLLYKESKWTAESKVFSDKAYDFYAYYPYNANVTDPTAIAVSAQADQTSGYNLSDVLASTKSEVAAEATEVPLTFNHAFSMVEVQVSGDLVKVQPTGDITLDNVQTAATLDLTTGKATANGSTASVKAYFLGGNENGGVYAYRAIIPAQTVAKDTQLLTVNGVGDKSYAMSYTAEVVYNAGKYRQLKMNIGKEKAELTIPTPTINPWDADKEIPGQGDEVTPPAPDPITSFTLDIANADVANLPQLKPWNNTGANACEDKANSYWFRRENATSDTEFKTTISKIGNELVLSRKDKPTAWMASNVGYHCAEIFEQGIYKVTVSTSSDPTGGSFGLAISNNEDKKLYVISSTADFATKQPARSVTVKENVVFYLDLTKWTDVQNSNSLTTEQVTDVPTGNINHLNIYLYNYNRTDGTNLDIKVSSLTIEKYVPAQ